VHFATYSVDIGCSLVQDGHTATPSFLLVVEEERNAHLMNGFMNDEFQIESTVASSQSHHPICLKNITLGRSLQ
jgi:hypothetical protein